jgi:hypothetical protein
VKGLLGFPFPALGLCLDFSVLDKDLDHVGEEAIEFGISALALGDGIHFPALVRLLGSSFPDRGRTYIVVFPFPDWDWDWARRLSNFVVLVLPRRRGCWFLFLGMTSVFPFPKLG